MSFPFPSPLAWNGSIPSGDAYHTRSAVTIIRPCCLGMVLSYLFLSIAYL